MKMLIKNISLVIVDVNSNIIFSSIIFDKNSNEMLTILLKSIVQYNAISLSTLHSVVIMSHILVFWLISHNL
jgi:hypothetical protein